jgi:hypothetical protein
MHVSHVCSEKSSLEATRGLDTKSVAFVCIIDFTRSISMTNKPFQSSNRRQLIAVAFVLASSSALASEPDQADANIRLTIVPEYYAVGSAHFNDLDAVQAWLHANGSRVEAIDRCASTGEAQLLAAIGMLVPPPGEVLELRTLPSTAPDCVRDREGTEDGGIIGFPGAEDYAATDEFGRSVIP